MINLGSIPGTDKNPDLVTYTIKSDGKNVTDRIKVLSLAVRKEINRIPSADLVLIDGEASEQTFETSSKDFFVPGKEVEILVGYHSDEKTLFKGIVVQHNIRIRSGKSQLLINCRDASFKLTIAPKNRYFEEVTDSDAIDTILSEYQLQKDVATTSVQHQELVQYNATDWDFILSRADVNAAVCLVDDGQVQIAKPDFNQDPAVECSFGDNIYALDADMDARNQYDGTAAKSWDFAAQELAEAEGKEPAFSGTGNLSGADLSRELKQPAFDLYHSGNIPSPELQAWADAKLLHSRLAQVNGRVKIQGTADVKPGQMIELKGLGDRFNGKVYVSGVYHEIRRGAWYANLQFGLTEKWYNECFTISAPPASGLLPGIKGLQIGLVTQLESDPSGDDRIKVRFPIVDPAAEGIWCRLSCLDAGSERGTYFRPEIDDEVIVGFINGDPRDAVVLGMLHSSAKPTPEPITNDNHKKGYLSREKLSLQFDDELKAIILETPAGNRLVLDEDAGGITMQDQNGNKIVMDSAGITIESAKDIQIKTGAGDAALEAINIDVKAQANLVAEGGATAELSAGATTTIEGGLVKIN